MRRRRGLVSLVPPKRKSQSTDRLRRLQAVKFAFAKIITSRTVYRNLAAETLGQHASGNPRHDARTATGGVHSGPMPPHRATAPAARRGGSRTSTVRVRRRLQGDVHVASRLVRHGEDPHSLRRSARFVPRMLEDAQGKLNLERTPTRRPADDGFEDVERAEERPVHDGREDWGVMPREQRGRKRAKGRRKEPIGFHGHGTTLKPPRRR